MNAEEGREGGVERMAQPIIRYAVTIERRNKHIRNVYT